MDARADSTEAYLEVRQTTA